MNQEGTPSPILGPEFSETFRSGMAQQSNNTWKTVSFILGLILAGGTLFSVLGKAFYVTRNEYTDKVLADGIEKTEVKKTLEAVTKSMQGMETALRDLSVTVDSLKWGRGKNP
jgi:hypothetical protein